MGSGHLHWLRGVQNSHELSTDPPIENGQIGFGWWLQSCIVYGNPLNYVLPRLNLVYSVLKNPLAIDISHRSKTIVRDNLSEGVLGGLLYWNDVLTAKLSSLR